MSLAAKIIEEMEKNAELRRKFFRALIADLMLDPDLRLAIVSALIREVTTKGDLAEVEKRVETSIDDLKRSVVESLENVPSKDSVKELSLKVDAIARDMEEFKGIIGVVEGVGERFNRVEDKVDSVKSSVEAFEVSFSNLTSKLDDSMSKIGSTIVAIQEKTYTIENRVSRLTALVFVVMLLALIAMVAQVLEVLGLIP